MTVPRWVIVSLAAAVVGYHVVVAIHSLPVIIDPVPYLIATAVFVAAATVSLLPWGGLRMPTWVAMMNLLVSMVVPEVVLRQISAQAQVQVDHAAWYVGGIGILMVITSVRRHHLFAWLGVAALVAHTILSSHTPAVSLIGVGMSVAWVGTSHAVSVLLDRAERDARQFGAAAQAAALWRAESEAHVTERQARLRQTNRVARGLLQQIVAREGRLTDELRAECVLLEATIRDEIRGRLLLDDGVRGAVLAARRSGVEVMVLDEGGLDDLAPEVLERVRGGIVRALGSVRSSRIVVRTAQDREGVAATVVGVGSEEVAAADAADGSASGEDAEDVQAWFEVGFTGEVRGLR